MNQGWMDDPYIKIVIMDRVIYKPAHKKSVNVVVSTWSISNSFKKLMFWLINSSLPNWTYFISGIFLAQIRVSYYATMISNFSGQVPFIPIQHGTNLRFSSRLVAVSLNPSSESIEEEDVEDWMWIYGSKLVLVNLETIENP